MKEKTGETNLDQLIANMEPVLNTGEYVFTTVQDTANIPRSKSICEMKEPEGITVILQKEDAVTLGLSFEYVASWITLKVHSSLEAIGLTAAFSSALSAQQISCNVVAGYFHDHIFINKKDAQKALTVLKELSKEKKNQMG